MSWIGGDTVCKCSCNNNNTVPVAAAPRNIGPRRPVKVPAPPPPPVKPVDLKNVKMFL